MTAEPVRGAHSAERATAATPAARSGLGEQVVLLVDPLAHLGEGELVEAGSSSPGRVAELDVYAMRRHP